MDQWVINSLTTFFFCLAAFALGFKFGMEYLKSQMNRYFRELTNKQNGDKKHE